MIAARANVSVMASVLTAAMFFAASTGISFAQVKNAKAVVETAAGKRSGDSAFIDRRDGKKYRTVVIGGKRWMAQNLNYQPQTGNFWCYDNDPSNCNVYGILYDWNTAMTVCPAGWHLPSRQEWGNLAKTAGGTGDYGTGGTAGEKFKSTSGWGSNDYDNGTDNYGFSALPGGYRYVNGSFNLAGTDVYWWTATEYYVSLYAYARNMGYNDYVVEADYYKENGFSVRCVMD